jgi:hypothetical protein
MIRSITLPVFLAVIVFVLSLLPRDAEGCAAVRRSDRQDPPIRIAEESAIVVWDPVKKIEHFIRRAAFDTPSPDFAFLVPTPTLPVLKEVEDSIFRSMDKWIMPKIVEKADIRFAPLFCFGARLLAERESVPGRGGQGEVEEKDIVRILAELSVGGFKATVLEADTTEPLAKWLKENGYSNDPELQSWLFPYVAAKWKITAFKITQDPKTGLLATTKPVRMTFAAERPFFPYREPEEKPRKKEDGKKQVQRTDFENVGKEGQWNPNGSRLLRVFFVSASPMEGKLGDAAWHANVPWADQLTDAQRKEIAAEAGLAADDVPAKAWLTTFEDSASPRPGKEEVYFDPAKDLAPVRPPDFIRYYDVWIPMDCVLGGVALVLLVITVVVKWRRKHAA